MKAPESALARKILDDPEKAEGLIDAILSARESRQGSAVTRDGKLKVSLVRKVVPIAQPED